MQTTQCKIIAIANQKGGVGKTTTTTNIATALASTQRRCLVIDMDPQGNAGTTLGFTNKKKSIQDVMLGKASITQSIYKSFIPQLSVVLSNSDLIDTEIMLADKYRWQYILKEKLTKITENYDYILIDCPPSLGILTINALTTAHDVIIPMQCEFFALKGLNNLLQNISSIRQNLNPSLCVGGVLLTMHDARNELNLRIAKEVRVQLGKLVYETVIPRSIAISEATSHCKPALIYDYQSMGSRAYMYVVREILAQNQK